MERQRLRATFARPAFRSLVKDCAAEPQLIESFNRAYGVHLQAPIAALLEDRHPPRISKEEELLLSRFILFVYEQIWMRLQQAHERTPASRSQSDPYLDS